MRNSMEAEIDGETVAAEAKMLRSVSTNSIMLVEGASDERVFLDFINEKSCDIVIAHGRENALTAHSILERSHFSGFLCIVDLDHSRLLGTMIETENLFCTDEHDLEIMMLRSPAFDRVLREYGSSSKLECHRSSYGNPLDLISKAAHPIGILRFYSLLTGKRFKFEGMKYSFVDRRTLAVDFAEMVKAVAANTRLSLDKEEHANIVAYIQSENSKTESIWDMCCGHDATAILGKSLVSLFGSCRTIDVDASCIEKALRLAYSYEDFCKSNLYQKILGWETRSPPYRCLR